MRTIDFVILFIYLSGMIGVGIWARKRIKNMDDFMLGGRRFNLLALVGTIVATMVGSGMTIGSVGKSYSGNTIEVFWMYLGFALGLFGFAFMVKKIRTTKLRTMGEVIGQGFGKGPRLVTSFIIIAYATGLVAINIAGLRTLILAVFGESLTISLPLATVIAALIAISYTTLGGFYAVVITDQIQFIIMLLGVFILGPIIGLSNAGSMADIAQAYTAIDVDFFNFMPEKFFTWGAFGIFLAYLLAVPGDPSMPQRALAAKDDKTAFSAYLIAGSVGLYFGFALIIIGGACFVLMPGIEAGDSILPSFILRYYPPVISGITIAGATAAVMSSFDSFLVIASTHTVYDFGRTINPDLSDEKIKKMIPVLTLVIGGIGIIIALFITSLFNYLWMLFSLICAGIIPAFFGSLYFKTKITDVGIIASVLVGLVIVIWGYTTWNELLLVAGDPLTTGLIGGAIALVVGSFFGTKGKVSENLPD